MNNQNQEIKLESAQPLLQQWQDLLSDGILRRFFTSSGDNAESTPLIFFQLNPEDIDRLLKNKGRANTKMELHLGLQGTTPTTQRFCPLLKVYEVNHQVQWYELVPGNQVGHVDTGVSVSPQQASRLMSAWHELVTTGSLRLGVRQFVQTAFHYVKDEEATELASRSKRFRYFNFTEDFNDIMEHLDRSGDFRLYLGATNFMRLGADFGNKYDKLYFAPIINVTGIPLTLPSSEESSPMEEDNGSTGIFNYSRPCPPTCP